MSDSAAVCVETWGNPRDEAFPASASKLNYPRFKHEPVCLTLAYLYFVRLSRGNDCVLIPLCSVCRHAARSLLGHRSSAMIVDDDHGDSQAFCSSSVCTACNETSRSTAVCRIRKLCALTDIVFLQLQRYGQFLYSADSTSLDQYDPLASVTQSCPPVVDGKLSLSEVLAIEDTHAHRLVRIGERIRLAERTISHTGVNADLSAASGARASPRSASMPERSDRVY